MRNDVITSEGFSVSVGHRAPPGSIGQLCPAPSFQEGPVGALTWPRCKGSSWKCLGTSFAHPTHPIFLTWEVTLGLGHDGDARLGSGFKVAAETSGSGTEAGGEAVVCPADPGRGGGRWGIYRHCRSGNMGWGWMWPPPLEPLLHAMNSGHPNPPPARTIPGQWQGLALQEDDACTEHVNP